MSTASPEGASVPATIPCPMCGMPVTRGAKKCQYCAEPLGKGDIPGLAFSESELAALASERDALLALRKRFNRLSFLLFGIGALLAIVFLKVLAPAAAERANGEFNPAGLVMLIPMALILSAVGCYAKYKGRSLVIVPLAFLGCLGLLLLALVPDKHQRRLKEIELLLREQA